LYFPDSSEPDIVKYTDSQGICHFPVKDMSKLVKIDVDSKNHSLYGILVTPANEGGRKDIRLEYNPSQLP
jgi:hypothetical protein